MRLAEPAALQPRRDRGVRADHQPVRCDAGPLAGLEVNAITKSGTNMLAGYVLRLLPRRPLQRGRLHPESRASVLGPAAERDLRRPDPSDRIHFFGNYEYEREPQTVTFNSPTRASTSICGHAPRQGRRAARRAVLAADASAGARSVHLPAASNPNTGGAPGIRRRGVEDRQQRIRSALQLTQVLDNRALNELKVGHREFTGRCEPDVTWTGPTAFRTSKGCTAVPVKSASRASRSARRATRHSTSGQEIYSVRDDFTTSFTRGTPRAEDRRRVHLAGQSGTTCHPLQRPGTSTTCQASGQHRAAVPGLGRRLDLEPGAAVADHRELRAIVRRLPRGRATATCVAVVAGRLGGRRPPDAEPRVRCDMDLARIPRTIEFLPFLPGYLPYDAE